jgi:hypothetical protein
MYKHWCMVVDPVAFRGASAKFPHAGVPNLVLHEDVPAFFSREDAPTFVLHEGAPTFVGDADRNGVGILFGAECRR